MGKASTTKKREQRTSPAERRDYIDILTNDQLRAALTRRKQELSDKLADVVVNKMMPDYPDWPDEMKERLEKNAAIYVVAIEDIDRRINGADKILRSFSGRDPKDEATE